MSSMLTLDGAQGEGGGQILRTSLALSMVTQTPIRLTRIRAGRAKPGLQRQHLTAVLAAKQVGCATVQGAELNSTELVFSPSVVVPGSYRFAIGTAGSVSLVLQTVLPALMTSERVSQLVLEGGTHNTMAPPYDFLARVFVPLLERMGPRLTLSLEKYGFYPAGGGQMQVTLEPTKLLQPLTLLERGPVERWRARALVSHLPESVAARELNVLAQALRLPRECLSQEGVTSAGPGNIVMLEAETPSVTELFSAVGEKGLPAEQVASRVAEEALRWQEAEVPVGEHLADQLLLPLALAGKGSFRTVKPSLHTMTNLEVIRRFLGTSFRVEQESELAYRIEVG